MNAVMPLAVVLSGVLAGVVLWVLSRLPLARANTTAPAQEPLCFLFQDGLVTDHTAGETCEVKAAKSRWTDLRAWFGARFPGLPDEPPVLQPGQTRRIAAAFANDPAVLEITGLRRGKLRLEMTGDAALPPAEQHDLILGHLSAPLWYKALNAAPCGVSILNDSGRPDWSNAMFAEFGEDDIEHILETVDPAGGPDQTVTLTDRETEKPRHFRLRSDTADETTVLYTTDVTQLIEADTMRSSFIQTLTKTFADLATGLVVFDRRQRLVLFNPAIIDLTGLPAEFLSVRPGVMEFFDRLRDNQVLPEPKNYASWRVQITDMIETAVDGHYAEAWTLPNGVTYRVTGRPHPDGAIAFLFEDITDEVSTTRRSRSQLEIRQAALDNVRDAVAVAGPNGLLVFCNRPFRDILGFDPDSSFAETGFDDLVALCRDRFPDHGFWDKVLETKGRQPVIATLPNGTHGPSIGQVRPLTGGFTMLQITPHPAPEPVSA